MNFQGNYDLYILWTRRGHYVMGKGNTLYFTLISMQVFKLTPEELAARKEILVLSDKGLRFREEVRQE